ncbi:Vacuolar protein sorting-associated protein 74 [Leucoagaricus sp. SymC.cos]|nr:Vacuolar protein sorting-associated protein 74 [Leucoagaricus sp. SymC.cos]
MVCRLRQQRYTQAQHSKVVARLHTILGTWSRTLRMGENGWKMPRSTIMEERFLLGLKDKQSYLSYWNDNISYALRGRILIEPALRGHIALVKNSNPCRLPAAEWLVKVIDDRQTGETILQALKLMKTQQATEKLVVANWIDLLSCAFSAVFTWIILMYLSKGLIDKGRPTDRKQNFLLCDMATHPVVDVRTKEFIINRIVSLLTSTTSTVPASPLDVEGIQYRTARAICLTCTAYTVNVLDNAFGHPDYEAREAAFQRCGEILGEWPFSSGSWDSASTTSRQRQRTRIAMGSENSGRESVLGLVQEVRREIISEEDVGFELIRGVLEVLSKLDSLL